MTLELTDKKMNTFIVPKMQNKSLPIKEYQYTVM